MFLPLNTGRKSIRGFDPGGFDLFYAAGQSVVTPDRLLNCAIASELVHVVLTPDRGLAESASFLKAWKALERGEYWSGQYSRRIARLPVLKSHSLTLVNTFSATIVDYRLVRATGYSEHV